MMSPEVGWHTWTAQPVLAKPGTSKPIASSPVAPNPKAARQCRLGMNDGARRDSKHLSIGPALARLNLPLLRLFGRWVYPVLNAEWQAGLLPCSAGAFEEKRVKPEVGFH